MRAFIPRDIFCNDGDLIFRLEEKQSRLKTRYASSKTQKGSIRLHSEAQEDGCKCGKLP